VSDEQLLGRLGQLAREQANEPLPEELLHPSEAEEAGVMSAALGALATGGSMVQVPTPPEPRPPWSQRFRTRLSLFVVAPAVAAAAAIWLFLSPGTGPGLAPLPGYTLEATGGRAEMRGPEDSRSRRALLLSTGVTLELVMRPETEVEGAVGAKLYWVKDGWARRWPAVLEQAPGGAIRVRAPAAAPMGKGPGEVAVLVGRPDSLPESDEGLAAELLRETAGIRLLRWPVVWE
jgi:hypothetical protein